MDIEDTEETIELAWGVAAPEGTVEMENVFDKAPKRNIWDFPRVDLHRNHDDEGVHTHSTVYVKMLPHQEAELIVILEEWLGQRL